VSISNNDRFLSYYNDEMRYLRNAGQLFAKRNPKIAERLAISDAVSPDPHTERLLESFAFLSAKLSMEIDERFPELANIMLRVLYPHLVNPVPSMTIAQIQPDIAKAKQAAGHVVKRHTTLFTYSNNGVPCKFQTVYPVKLWPMKVVKADFMSRDDYVMDDISKRSAACPWFLRLTIKIQGGLSLKDLNLDDITIHFGGDMILASTIYRHIFATAKPQVLVSLGGKRARVLPTGSLQALGFSRDETCLPVNENTTHAYHLMQEYFQLPEKYLFCKISNLSLLQRMSAAVQGGDEDSSDNDTFELLLPVRTIESVLSKNMGPQNFLFGCTPIVNLFHKTTEPLRITQRQVEYPLIPDQRREETTQIYTVKKVIATIEGVASSRELSSYFAFNSRTNGVEKQLYWFTRRMPPGPNGGYTNDVRISFVDANFNPVAPARQIVYAETLCTNRFLAESLPKLSPLQIEGASPVGNIFCLKKPVAQGAAPSDGESLWRLVSQLSVNYLGLSDQTNSRREDDNSSLKALKHALRLYAGSSFDKQRLAIDEITGMRVKKVVRRFGDQAWRGFAEGLEVLLDLNPSAQSGHTSFLLAAVLQHYLALNVHSSSFVELALRRSYQDEEELNAEEWIRWELLPGAKTLL